MTNRVIPAIIISESEGTKMLKKNIEKKERSKRAQTFVGCRPTRFKKKTTYTRKGRRKGDCN